VPDCPIRHRRNLVVPANSIDVRFDDAGQLIGYRCHRYRPGRRPPRPLTVRQQRWPAGQRPERVERRRLASGAAICRPGRREWAARRGCALEAQRRHGRRIHSPDPAHGGYQMNAKVVQAWDDVQRMANEFEGRITCMQTCASTFWGERISSSPACGGRYSQSKGSVHVLEYTVPTIPYATRRLTRSNHTMSIDRNCFPTPRPTRIRFRALPRLPQMQSSPAPRCATAITPRRPAY